MGLPGGPAGSLHTREDAVQAAETAFRAEDLGSATSSPSEGAGWKAGAGLADRQLRVLQTRGRGEQGPLQRCPRSEQLQQDLRSILRTEGELREVC